MSIASPVNERPLDGFIPSIISIMDNTFTQNIRNKVVPLGLLSLSILFDKT